MSTHVLRSTMTVPVPLETVFSFFANAENLGQLTPDDLRFAIRTPLPIAMEAGTLIDYRIALHGVPMRWRTLISAWNPPFEFIDVQLKGPYAQWVHRHTFAAAGRSTTIRDEVHYRLPLGVFGDLAHPLVRRQLLHIFGYRQQAVVSLLADSAGQPATLGPIEIS
ncbi:MAG: SRPBCC family protein [Gemmatimonadaceae bacterium]